MMPVRQEIELPEIKTVLAYANNIMAVGNLRAGVILVDLMVATKTTGLVVNQGKTKYTVIDRRTRDTPDIRVSNYTFKAVYRLLETYINNNMYIYFVFKGYWPSIMKQKHNNNIEVFAAVAAGTVFVLFAYTRVIA